MTSTGHTERSKIIMGTIFDHTLRNGGGTFDAQTLQPIARDSVTAAARPYVVGGARGVPERVFDLDIPSTPRNVDLYVRRLAQLRGVQEVGTWIDEDRHAVVIDAVERHSHRSTALQVAGERGEDAIFDLLHDETISTEPDAPADLQDASQNAETFYGHNA